MNSQPSRQQGTLPGKAELNFKEPRKAHECSAIIQRLTIPKKLEDPGCFTLPCAIGPLMFERCLCDLGASVSLMSLYVAKQLGFSQYKKCRLSLVLADRSVKFPIGILEDLLVMVGNSGAIINVKEGKIDLHLGKEHTLHFDINEIMKRPTVQGQIFFIEEMEALADELLEELALEDSLQHALTIDRETQVIENKESAAYGNMLDSHKRVAGMDQYEELQQETHQASSATQQEDTHKGDWSELKALKVELKHLPDFGQSSSFSLILVQVFFAHDRDKRCCIVLEILFVMV
ncbi:hypothetical protein Bca101_025685 [Brassica carinata]